jgi:hypothetical protein
MRTSKNKIRTAGYFIKRLRDSGFIVIKSFFRYSKSDPRRWTVIVDPSNTSVFVTCFTNKNFLGEVLFKLDDGDQKIPGSMYLKTDSIEVVISYLLNKGASNDNKNSLYIKKDLNTYNEV